MSVVAIGVCVAIVLLYVFESLRKSVPVEALADIKELSLKLEKSIPVEFLPFLTNVAKTVLPVAANVEKVAITEAKKLLAQYALETDTPLDNALCEWLENLEKEKGA